MKDNDKPTTRTVLRILIIITVYAIACLVLFKMRTVLVWVAIAGFLALAFNPVVNRFTKYMPLKHRGLAILSLFLCVGATLALLAFIFIPPLVSQTQTLVRRLPEASTFFQKSDSPIARKARQYDLVPLIKNNQSKISAALSDVSGSAVDVVRTLFKSIAATLTILVLTAFMLANGPSWIADIKKLDRTGWLKRHSHLLERMSETISGYVNGNLLTSLIAAVATALVLTVLRVQYAVPLGLLVGIFDLIPLIGATLGAVVVLTVATIHSLTAGIVVLIFYVVYQQIENHILQPYVYSKTVQLSPFLVLVSALAGAELGGLLGALVAIPLAANIQILAQTWWSGRNA